jgi:hypothetical protein
MTETSADCPGGNRDQQLLDSPEHWQNATPEQLVLLTKECIERYDGFLPSWFMDYPVRGKTIWAEVAEVFTKEYGPPQQIQNSEVDGIQTGVFKSSTSKQGYFRLKLSDDIKQVLYPPVRGAFFGNSETMRPDQINKAWLRSISHFLSIHPQLFCPDSAYPLYHPGYTAHYISEEQLPGTNIPCDVVVIMKEKSIEQVLPVTRYWEGQKWDGVQKYFRALLDNHGVLSSTDHNKLLGGRPENHTSERLEIRRLNNMFGVRINDVATVYRTRDYQCLSAMDIGEAIRLRHAEWLEGGKEAKGHHEPLPEMELYWLESSETLGLPVLPRRLMVKNMTDGKIHTIQIPYGMFAFLEYLRKYREIDLDTIVPYQKDIVNPYDRKQTFKAEQLDRWFHTITRLFKEIELPSPILYFSKGSKRYCWRTEENRAEYQESHTVRSGGASDNSVAGKTGDPPGYPVVNGPRSWREAAPILERRLSLEEYLSIAREAGLQILPQEHGAENALRNNNAMEENTYPNMETIKRRLELHLHWANIRALRRDTEKPGGSQDDGQLYYEEVRPTGPLEYVYADVFFEQLARAGRFDIEQYIRLLRRYYTRAEGQNEIISVIQAGMVPVKEYLDKLEANIDYFDRQSAKDFITKSLLGTHQRKHIETGLWLPLHVSIAELFKEETRLSPKDDRWSLAPHRIT